MVCSLCGFESDDELDFDPAVELDGGLASVCLCNECVNFLEDYRHRRVPIRTKENMELIQKYKGIKKEVKK